MSKKNCPICKNKNISKVLGVKNFPYFTAPINKDVIDRDKISNKVHSLNVVSCKKCSHLFLSKIPNLNLLNNLYDKYYNYPSPIKGIFKPERDDNFIKIFLKNNKNKKKQSIFEVGCYDGYILKKLSEKGYKVLGCDPSKGALIGKKMGIPIRKEFFNSSLYKYEKYDFVITRHLIEHIVNPIDWLKNLLKGLKNDGKLVIETPNVDFFLKRGLPSVFSLQHLQYFTKYSLSILLNNLNCKVEKIYQSNENLIFFVKKNKKSKKKIKIKNNNKENLKKFRNKYLITKKMLQKEVMKNNVKKISVWGAGGFGSVVHLFYELPAKKISFYVDSDPKKTKMRFLTSNASIYNKSYLRVRKPHIIVITSLYGTQILKSLKNENLEVKVINLFPKTKIYQI